MQKMVCNDFVQNLKVCSFFRFTDLHLYTNTYSISITNGSKGSFQGDVLQTYRNENWPTMLAITTYVKA